MTDAKDGGRCILFYYGLHFIRHRTPKAFLLENVEETWGAWLSDLRRDGRSWRQSTMASHSADTGYTLLASGKTSIMDRLFSRIPVFQDPVAWLPLEVFLDEHAYTSMIDHGATRWRI